jgi:predicted nucleic acid-binding protein
LILDTNALSAMADGNPKLRPILEGAAEIAIPFIVLGEYMYGIRQSRSRARYERWLTDLTADCRVLVADETTAERYAEIRGEMKLKGRAIPGNDFWIAALTRQHRLPLVSRDQHFDSVEKLTRIDW